MAKAGFLLFFTLFTALTTLGQESNFPYQEGFEAAFTTGTDVAFIPNWTGNEVATSSRIFQGNDARTGSSSLNIIPISTFQGEISLALDLSSVSLAKISFYAFSKQNGSGSSTRPVLLSVATSIDGGNTFIANEEIGDATTFPNDNTTSYTQYEYSLPVQAGNEAQVIVRLVAQRGEGSGSAAELVIDDFVVEEQVLALSINEVGATDPTTLQVTFNQEVTTATAQNAANYAIDGGVSVISATRTATNVVQITTSQMGNANYQLTVNGVEDDATQTPANNLQANFTFVLPLAIVETSVFNKNNVRVTFNQDLEQATAENIAFFTVDSGLGNPSSATMNGRGVNLQFADDLQENNYTLTVNGVRDASTLATANALTSAFTYLPLQVNAVAATDAQTVTVTFNQAVAAASATNTSHYAFNFGKGSPVQVVQDPGNAARVTLILNETLANNTYTLTINQVANVSGNALAENVQAALTFETATPFRQLVINEIFADPTGNFAPNPQVLPNETNDEFIELYNAGTEAIDLANFDLTGGSIGTFVLNPGAYVVLTATSNVADYQPFGNVVGVSSWNTLTNGGEQIVLNDNLGNLVDSLTYDLSWYGDGNKSDGAWTLEQINPEAVCSDVMNWSASTSAAGGTPGAANAILDTSPDTTDPEIAGITINSPQQLTVYFSELMDISSLENATYSFSGGLQVNQVNVVLPFRKAVILDLVAPMTSGTFYDLTLTGATDCARNGLEQSPFNFLFDNEPPVLERIIFQSEKRIDLLFDEPLALNPAETESFYILNQGLGNPSGAERLADNEQAVSLTFSDAFVLGTNYTLTYEQLTDTLGNAMAQQTENFTWRTQIDSIGVINSQLLHVFFKENVNVSSAENREHYFLDRGLGRPAAATIDPNSNAIVHLAFDQNFPENRDLILRFEDIQAEDLSLLQTPATSFEYDTDDPDVTEVEVVSQNELRIHFDEQLEVVSAESVNHFSVNNVIGLPQSALLEANDSSILLQFGTDFTQEVENRLTLTGIADLFGNVISTNRNYDFMYDTRPPRLDTVILRSPTELEVIYSEEVIQSFAEEINNYAVNNGIGSPNTAVRNPSQTNRVLLTFDDLGNREDNVLTIANISDVFANALSSQLEATFSTVIPQIGRFTILADTLIQIQFSKRLSKASAEDIENYGFDGGIGPFSALQDLADASIVNLTLTTPLRENQSFRMVVQNQTDSDGNVVKPVPFDFVYDDKVVQIELINANTLQLTFEEALSTNEAQEAGNYIIDKSIGTPVTAVLDPDTGTRVTLIFANALEESKSYQLKMSNLLTHFGEVVPASRHVIDFDVSPPKILSVRSSFFDELVVVFDEPVDRTTALTFNHYSVNQGIGQPMASELSVDATEVTLQFAEAMVDGLEYEMVVRRVRDLQAKTMADTTINFTFQAPVNPSFRDLVINEVYFDTEFGAPLPNREFIEIYNRSNEAIELRDLRLADDRDTAVLQGHLLAPNGYLILTSLAGKRDYEPLGTTMAVRDFPSLSDVGETIALLNRDLSVIDSLAYDRSFYQDDAKINGGYTVELINPNKPCFDVLNYTASTDEDRGTPGQQNAVFDITADTRPPQLTDLKVLSATQLHLTFDEAMDVSGFIPDNFQLDGVSISDIFIQDIFGKQVVLELNEPFERGVSQSLSFSGLRDCTGNVLSGSETFLLGAVPQVEELLVTEIMFDPSPSRGLPEVEYVELYNASQKVLSLDSVKLSDNNVSNLAIPSFDLNPSSYVILTRTTQVDAMQVYGDAIGVTSFPSLANEDEIRLTNTQGDVIFEVKYNPSFLKDQAKLEGGYSIEMINLSPACFSNANWSGSTHVDGGTPGRQNSVFDDSPDEEAPQVLSFKVISERLFEINFSEAMDISTLTAQNFVFSSGLSLAEVVLSSPFGQVTELVLSENFPRGALHELTLQNLTDCAGNRLPDTTFNFSMGTEPQMGDLIITEIMAIPAPSQGVLPESEYVEIYNTSSKIISLSGVMLADAVRSTVLSGIDISPGEYIILTPSSVADDFASFGKVLGVSGWPNLNNSGDRVALFTAQGDLLFEVNYTDEWYRSSARKNGGFSLEMIDLNFPCVEEPNWIASSSAEGGSPGKINAAAGNNPDLQGPRLLQAVALDDANVRLVFNEKLNVAGIDLSDFSINHELSFIAVQVAENGKEVTLTTQSDLVSNTVYQIVADNIADCSGNLIQAGQKEVRLIIPAEAAPLDIIVNEILFHPLSGGARFVELYNNSSKYINLKNWKVSGLANNRTIADEDLFMEPGTYFTITNDGAALQRDYPKAKLETFVLVSSMPSLPTDQGAVFILDDKATEMDRFEYSADFHSPLLDDERGVALERIQFNGPSNDPENWFSASSAENFATPGYFNSQSLNGPNQIGGFAVDPPSFAPDIPGMGNFTTINYTFNQPGNMITVKVLDTRGGLVKHLVKNSLVGVDGFFTWDGTKEDGTKAQVGYYMVLIEIVSNQGQVSYQREKVAIGTRL